MNAVGAEECVQCGARLKPLQVPADTPPQPPFDNSQDTDEPEWLRELRAGGQAPGDTPPHEPPETDQPDQPDWLSRIREKAREEASSDHDRPGEEDVPEWMQDLRTDAAAGGPDEDALPGAAETGDDDWLGRLEQEQPLQADAGGQDEPVTGDSEDWMSKLSAWQPGSEAEPGVEEPDQESSGWAQPEQPESSFDPSEWSQKPPSEEEALPDWLNGPGLAGDAPVENMPVSDAEAGREDLLDWLGSFDLEASDQPDLASGSGAVGEGDASFAGLPEWTSDDASEAGQQATPDGAGEDELPDWFASFTGPDKPGEIQAEPSANHGEEPALPGSPLPDWLNDVSEAAVEAQAEPEETPLQSGADELDEEGVLAEPGEPPVLDGDTPEWLRDFNAQLADDEGAPPSTAGEDHESIQPAGLDVGQSFEAGELPEWLTEDAGETALARDALPEELDQQAEPADGEELAQADLPEWIREMRPIESVSLDAPVPAEVDQRVENAGPLAGLRGILPAEDMVTRYHKPPVYSSRLRISEKQRSQASLLDSILEQEALPVSISLHKSHAPRLIGRVLVSLLMLAMVLLPFMTPLGLEPALMRTPPELLEMFQEIDQTAQIDRPVLLAVDYEPALAGEMYMTALPVVEHLMARNIRLVIVSTVPSGPVLAQSLLDGAVGSLAGREQPATYDLNSMTANLGYLPGGTISLLEFAQYPRLAAPASITGDYEIWNQAVLRPVTVLSDFAQVIVITDSAEIGRAWVEQVQPLMGSVPLFMVSSAQAEPMLMPFVDSGQIDGLAGGMLGGILYSQWRQVDTDASAYWPSYQIGMGVAFLLVLLGGLVSAGTALLRRGDKEEK